MDLVNIIGTATLAVVGLEMAIESIRTWHQDRRSPPETSCRTTSAAGSLAVSGQDRLAGMPNWTLGGWSEPF